MAGGDQAALAKLADAADPDAAPIFLPYLLPGEQGARWDPDLAGALSGLHLGHGPGDLARGLRNGIVSESRHCLAVLEAAAGRGEILLAGGGALAPSLATDLADATGPGTVEQLLNVLSESFPLVVCDVGHRLRRGSGDPDAATRLHRDVLVSADVVVLVSDTAAPPQVVAAAGVVARVRFAGSVSAKLDCVSAKSLEFESVMVSIDTELFTVVAGENDSLRAAQVL